MSTISPIQKQLNTVVKRIKDQKDSDSIAVLLWNEGVRKAVCGDSDTCALAQHVANQFKGNKNFSVSVDNRIHVYEDGRPVASVSTAGILSKFMGAFDNDEYSFLTSVPSSNRKARAR